MFLKGLLLFFVLLVERFHLELERLGRYELFLEHFLDQFAHFVVLAGNELFFELDGAEELGIIEFG